MSSATTPLSRNSRAHVGRADDAVAGDRDHQWPPTTSAQLTDADGENLNRFAVGVTQQGWRSY
jgi:hypothetical protein